MTEKNSTRQRPSGPRPRQRQTTLRLPPWLIEALAQEREFFVSKQGGKVSAAEVCLELLQEGSRRWGSFEFEDPGVWLQRERGGLIEEETKDPLRVVSVRLSLDAEARLDELRVSLLREEQVREKKGLRRPWWLQTLKHGEVTAADAARVALVWAVAARRYSRVMAGEQEVMARATNGVPLLPADENADPASENRYARWQTILKVLGRTDRVLREKAGIHASAFKTIFDELGNIYGKCIHGHDPVMALLVGIKWQSLGEVATSHGALSPQESERLGRLHRQLLQLHGEIGEVLRKTAPVSLATPDATMVGGTPNV